jgi:hypothetical protein
VQRLMRIPYEVRQHAANSLRELSYRHDQTHYSVPGLREIVKVAWVYVNASLGEQRDGQFLI